MNEKITTLLEQLAVKLGTTSEMLWKILIRQAPIEATIILIEFIAVGLMVFAWIKWLKWAYKEDKIEDFSIFVLSGGVSLAIMILVCVFCGISELINGYFNPDFWALNYILNKIK